MFTYGPSYWLADRPQLTPALPHSGHRFPQFYVRDVEDRCVYLMSA